ncbi:UDPGP type 1 family protein [bacterium 1XD8-76]|nr:UDPGP type 1 family protein [bacterium 1XD8-76]
MTYRKAYEKLEAVGQLHVLEHYDSLSETQKKNLLEDIALTDFTVLSYLEKREELMKKGVITPLAAMELPEIERSRSWFEELGCRAIRQGQVGAVLLAGGMGTRLGSNEPKGMYDIGLTKPVYIFERILSNLLDVVQKAHAWIHLFIMTSDKNHERTVAFLAEHDYFGYKPGYIHFFRQEMAPASDYNGKVYMERPDKIANSPNGNGGWYSSMANGRILEIVKNRGIEWLNVFAVDNVLQRMADPCFVGATIARGCSCGAKVVKKNAPDEKVGVMCLEDGRPSIVEYYDLTDELMHTKNENGEPAYNFGAILNYLFQVKALEQTISRKLPLHIVEKKIPHMDDDGNFVEPDKPNGYKYETLVLDMVHMMDSCLPYEVKREYEFAPIKNMTGIDSVDTARELCRINGIEL